jgi:hypothetical protein
MIELFLSYVSVSELLQPFGRTLIIHKAKGQLLKEAAYISTHGQCRSPEHIRVLRKPRDAVMS